MNRRHFLQALGSTVIGGTAIGQVTAYGPDIPPYVQISDDQDLITQFEESQVDDHDGDDWSWALTRYIHKDTASDCRTELGLDIPPYALYIYHLNAGRELSLEPATEKEGACIDLGFEFKIASVNANCITEIEFLGSDPRHTEVAEKAKSNFEDQLQEDLPISSSEWYFGLGVPGLIREKEWEYTKSEPEVFDKQTLRATIGSEERDEIHDPIFGGNDLELRCFLTTEKASRTGHYLATIGVVPVSDSIKTTGFLTDPVEFDTETYRENIRTLKKEVEA